MPLILITPGAVRHHQLQLPVLVLTTPVAAQCRWRLWSPWEQLTSLETTALFAQKSGLLAVPKRV
jgi:hypothetical protein